MFTQKLADGFNKFLADLEAEGYKPPREVEGAYVFDTGASGNSNSGHDYGTKLPPDEKRDLIEYLKTL